MHRLIPNRLPGCFRSRVVPALLSLAIAGWAHSQDSKPVLLSRTGGTTWSNAAELQAAANKGNPKACAQLGEMLLRGDGDFSRDVPRALTLLEQAARAGQASAAFRIGMLLENGDSTAKDQSRALAYFRAAAAGGSAEAFRNLGVVYSTGRGVKRDYAEALAWLILAKKRGTAGTVDDELRSYVRTLGHPEWIAAGEKRAPELERELADGTVAKFLPPPAPLVHVPPGDPGIAPPATASTPAPVEKPSAPTPGKIAPDTGILTALPQPPPLELPRLHTPADDEPNATPVKLVLPTGRALSWPSVATLQAAAARGEPDACAAFGQILLTGQQVPVDVSRAVVVLERGAKAGSADAAARLAELYSRGGEVERDPAQAFAFTLQAARGGVKTAIYNLGALYANGSGTKSDYTESLAWLIVAQHFNRDSGEADRIRAYLAKTDPKQIPLAEQRAADRVKEIENARANLPGL